MFQFLIGSLEALSIFLALAGVVGMFQFLIGSLEAVIHDINGELLFGFQFLIGSLEAAINSPFILPV